MFTKWIKDRVFEPSTWKGVAVATGAAGLFLSPDAWLAIGAAVASIWGAVDIIREEKKER